MMSVGELFAGIGGLGKGFEDSGRFEIKWQVEIEPYAIQVLEKHWPGMSRQTDVCTFPGDDPGNWKVDVVIGGFPCIDISKAGKQGGIKGKHSGLWSEFARIIGILRPRYVVVENVAAILVRGMGRVVGDLASLGYDAEWEVVPAGGPGGCGAPTKRERIFIVAYPDSTGLERRRILGPDARERFAGSSFQSSYWPQSEADILRVATGIPDRVDRSSRLKCLGNSVCPSVSRYIAEAIWEAHEE